MAQWDLQLEPAAAGAPVYVRIADAIRRDATRGRLSPGLRLPGARRLAAQLGVHRNTVTAAYDELEAQGWVETIPAKGRFVAEVPGARPPAGERRAVPRTAGYALGDQPPPRRPLPTATYDLGGGQPDLRLVPTTAIGRAYRRGLEAGGRRWLDYGPTEGHPTLRAQLAEMLASTRGLATTADDVLVLRGSQMALWLVGRALLRPGDVVAVEGYGYPPAWDAMRVHGASLRPIPVDGDGLDVRALASLCARERVRAVYVTPHHQYPTTVLMSGPRRLELLALARRQRFAIVEDDYDHELHYVGRPVLPLASRDTTGSVIYLGTLSKILAPGLRIGFVVAPPPVRDRLLAWREVVDRQGDHVVEAAVAELMEDGEVQRHAHRMRKIYGSRRDALLDAVRRELPDVQIQVPRGGLSLWAEAPGVDVQRWQERALRRGVRIRTARDFSFDGQPRAALRLGFSRHDEGALRDAVRALRRARP